MRMMRGRKQSSKDAKEEAPSGPRVPSPGCALHLRGLGLVGSGCSLTPQEVAVRASVTQLPCHAIHHARWSIWFSAFMCIWPVSQLYCQHLVPHEGGTRLCAPLPVLPQGWAEFKWVLQTSSRTHWPPGGQDTHQSPSMAWPRPPINVVWQLRQTRQPGSCLVPLAEACSVVTVHPTCSPSVSFCHPTCLRYVALWQDPVRVWRR